MPLYKLTYQFESSGGNIEYQTTQQVRKVADTGDIEVTLVTTGLSLTSAGIDGTAIVEVDAHAEPTGVFDSATTVQQVSPARGSEPSGTETGQEPASDPRPEDDISRFTETEEMATVLAAVSDTPGRGVLLYSNLTRFHPHERDLWLVEIQTRDIDATTGLTVTDVVEFYRDNLDVLTDEPALKFGCFHGRSESTIRLSLVASLTSRREARELADRASSHGAMNCYRFELSKESLVVGASTHGPGQVEAVFRNRAGTEVSSRDLAFRIWYDGLDVSFHPLGVVIDGDLYRPVPAGASDVALTSVGDPLYVETYRGAAAKPWQFGVTRHDGQLLMTQARGPPEKFDPVLKRFPVETQTVGEEPLVFSHTVSRRIWSGDSTKPHVQSHRSEGLVTQFLYADSDGWHLIQPKALGDPSSDTDPSFEPTQLDGVAVRSALLRAETDGETKATVEHEYRITADALAACDRLYALSYHEANEESVDRLEWEIADATAYEIVRDRGDI